ncbi:MAG: diaminopimelate decarboxylase [Acetivibrionales bacterium]|nr:diaminopimelate decarboxylase [Clostridiaceae bacterium]
MHFERDLIIKLAEKYGTPLYVYSEAVLRERCREMKNLLPGENVRINYSAKANTNLDLLKIIKDEGLDVDAMSPGEIYIEQLAGFENDRIFFIPNNVSEEEMKFAIERDILTSVDSLSQLEMFGKINPGGKVAVRFNPGIGAGHHEKVVTAGEKTKFGVQMDFIPQVKDILKKYNLKLVGINQHMGSLFLDWHIYIEGVKSFLTIAKEFPELEFVDIGGGFGVPYKPDEERLDLSRLAKELEIVIDRFIEQHPNKDIIIKMEPGRYIVAECGVLLGTVHSVKQNYGTTYIGTDIGFNVLVRPVMYDSYHEVAIIKKNNDDGTEEELVTVVGNICESGDILAKDRMLPKSEPGDIITVFNAGAYSYCMSSNYNSRLRPAEVLIDLEGKDRLIRKRDTLESLTQNFILDQD